MLLHEPQPQHDESVLATDLQRATKDPAHCPTPSALQKQTTWPFVVLVALAMMGHPLPS